MAADKLKEGEVTDERLRNLIVREIDGISGLARANLLSSISFLKEGIVYLCKVLDLKTTGRRRQGPWFLKNFSASETGALLLGWHNNIAKISTNNLSFLCVSQCFVLTNARYKRCQHHQKLSHSVSVPITSRLRTVWRNKALNKFCGYSVQQHHVCWEARCRIYLLKVVLEIKYDLTKLWKQTCILL